MQHSRAIMEHMQVFPRIVGYVGLIALAAFVGGCQYGFTLAIVAGAEPFISKQFGLTGWQLGFVVSNLDLGAVLGSALAGPLSDRLGRKKTLLATALVFLLSVVLTAAATTVTTLLLGRALGGLAIGAAMIMPLYVAEISPAKTRGLLVSLVQVGIVTGILAAFFTGWMAADAGPTNWRWMFGAAVVPAAVLLLAAVALPESPRWLASRNATSSALHVLTSVMGPREAQAALEAIQKSVQQESTSWRELLRPGIRRTLVIGLLLSILSVTVGINAVLLYGPVILMEGAGQDISTALLGAVALGCVNFLFSVVAMLAIDRLGRKPLLVCGLVGMGIAMLVLGFRFSVGTAESSPALLFPILSFVACYAVSLGPVTWVIVSEIFPTRTRGAGMAVCMILMFLADFVVKFSFPWMMDELGSGGFHVFAAVCGAGILFVLALVPETKGKSLEQIEMLWSAQAARSGRADGASRGFRTSDVP